MSPHPGTPGVQEWSLPPGTLPDEPVMPWVQANLTCILPSVGAHLGVPGCTDQLGLPPSRGYVLLMVDGLGWNQLEAHRGLAPHLTDTWSRPLLATVPSTTGTSLTSLGTGLMPGRHGVMGYLFRAGRGAPLINAVTWENGPDPRQLQPHPTVFELASAAGVSVTSVVPSRFEHSGLTGAALRGTRVSGMVDEDDLDERLQRTVAAADVPGPSLVYVYERNLDHTGHRHGVDSPQWRRVLRGVSDFAADLRDELPDDVTVLITGDHGMLDVPSSRRVVAEWEPSLMAGVEELAGEGRMRQVYTEEPEAVAQRWRRVLGERAWVVRREEAIEQGWFGPVDAAVLDRIGDVLVAMREDWAVMSTTLPGEHNLIGMHGSLTADEMVVPLVVDPGQAPVRG